MSEFAGASPEIIPPFVVGGNRFGLTEESVAGVIEDLKPIATGEVKAIMTQEEAKKVLGVLTSSSPAEILSKIKSVYDKVRELESERETGANLIAQIRTEFPDIMDYYLLLRKTMGPKGGWGYRLGQAVGAAKLADEEKAMYGDKT